MMQNKTSTITEPSSSQQHHQEHSTNNSRGRKLFGAPVLLQDWDDETEEGAFQYWELFLDLLLVAAASSITDQFKESQKVGEFIVFYLIILNGWLLYTHHITSRFQDNSLAHSILLFGYCLGFGCATVNVGYAYTPMFCYGAILQRCSVVIMLISVACAIPRARSMCAVVGTLSALTAVLLLVVAVLVGNTTGSSTNKTIEESPIAMTLFWIAALLEFGGEVVMAQLLVGRRMVPVNIDQTKERLGAMELVMLGESVLSVCIIYREWLSGGGEEGEASDGEEAIAVDSTTTTRFYLVLGYSFLLIFMFLLLYFHMQPSPADHALRRSRFHGTTLLVLHKILGLAYLAVGTAVKLVVESLLMPEPMPTLTSELMGYGVGASILILFGMRYLHYGGRDHINFGDKCLHFGRDPHLDRMASLWWLTIFVAGILPIFGTASGWTIIMLSLDDNNPVTLIGIYAGFVFVVVLLESFFSHSLQDGAFRQQQHSSRLQLDSGERTSLTAASAKQHTQAYS